MIMVLENAALGCIAVAADQSSCQSQQCEGESGGWGGALDNNGFLIEIPTVEFPDALLAAAPGKNLGRPPESG